MKELRRDKTTTATNLALAMASAGQKTLILDADLRNPRLHKAFDKSRSPGLTEGLYDESLSTDDILATDIDNLYVMPAGASAPNPSEVLGSQRMRALGARMEDRFDVVLLDTSPLLLFSDPVAVAPHTDGGILVASAGRTDRRAFEQALRNFRSGNRDGHFRPSRAWNPTTLSTQKACGPASPSERPRIYPDPSGKVPLSRGKINIPAFGVRAP